jgi:hypothetical protein
MTRDAQRQQLYEALRAHASELEIERSVTSGPDLEVLDRRIEAVRLLLEWIWRALALEPPASPEVQTPPPSGSPTDLHQTPPFAPDPPKTPRQ